MAPIKIVKDDTAKFLKSVKELTTQRVMVGVPTTTAERKGEPINNAELGYIHEHGAPEANIPARPFLVSGIESKQIEITAILKEAGIKALDGKTDGATNELNAAGIVGQNAVQAKITAGPFEPLKPGTIASRKRKGREGESPLIDTGALRQSITHVIRKTGEDQ